MDAGPIVLRYFDCRSRGQALRFALADAGVEFEDERVAIASIPDFRARPEGPFGQLPILRWGDFELAQTLPIAGYLEDRLAPGPRSAEQRAFLAMISSAAHLDTQVIFSQLLWRPVDQSEEKLLDALRRLLHVFLAPKLEQLERQLAGCGSAFFGGEAPSVADAFVYESLDRGRSVLGAPFVRLLDKTPRLAQLELALRERPRIAALHGEGRVAEQVTGNPEEPVLRGRIDALLGELS